MNASKLCALVIGLILIVACQMTNELEVVLQAKTNSYIGFGWKPRSKQLLQQTVVDQ